jgi:peroxiredoxin Q/BCP
VAQKSPAVAKFLEDNPLPFRVLIDSSRDVLRAYGVWHRIGLTAWNIARPALFLIGKDGTIVRQFVASRQDQFPGHEDILGWL